MSAATRRSCVVRGHDDPRAGTAGVSRRPRHRRVRGAARRASPTTGARLPGPDYRFPGHGRTDRRPHDSNHGRPPRRRRPLGGVARAGIRRRQRPAPRRSCRRASRAGVGARAARSASCVTTMTVAPCSARGPRADRSPPHRSRCRGCRSARRRGARAARRRARGRSRRAAARRRRAAPAGATARSASPTASSDAGVGRAARSSDAGRRERRLDVLACGQRRDQVELLEHEAERLEPQVGELAVAERARSRPSKQKLPEVGRSSAPSSCSSVVLPEPLGPATTTNSPGVDLEVDVVDGANLVGRAGTCARRRDVVERLRPLLDLPQCLGGAQARRANAPTAPAIRPPRTASRNPTSSTPTASGASARPGRYVPPVTWPRPKRRRRRPCSTSPQRRADRSDRRRAAARARRRARRRGRPARATRPRPGAPRAAASSRSPSGCRARACACPPTRASAAPRSGTRTRGDHDERRRACPRGSTRRRASRSRGRRGGCGRHLRTREEASICFATLATDPESSARTSRTFDAAFAVASFWSWASGTYTSEGCPPSGGRTRPTTVNGGAVQVELRAELQALPARVGGRASSASLPPALGEKRPFETSDGVTTPMPASWSTPPIV